MTDYCGTCGVSPPEVHWQGCQTSAKAEHANPEQSPELLRVELQACKTRIGEMRREINTLTEQRDFARAASADWQSRYAYADKAANLRAEIIYQLWPETVEARRWDDDEPSLVDHLVHDGVLSEEAADELRRVLGVS